MATTVTSTTHDFVAKCTAMAMDILRLPARHMWVDYDQEADVLYMSFRKPQNATKTIEVDDDILVRKIGRTVVGLTILNASTKGGEGIAGIIDQTLTSAKFGHSIDSPLFAMSR